MAKFDQITRIARAEPGDDLSELSRLHLCNLVLDIDGRIVVARWEGQVGAVATPELISRYEMRQRGRFPDGENS